jgi:hypothetical protein
VHVWEAKTDYIYDPPTDKISFKGYLLRDGSIAGARNETTGEFFTIASNCTIELYYSNGTMIDSINTSDVTSAGFFSLEYPNVNSTLNTSIVYPAVNMIITTTGGIFRTPFLLNLVPTASLHQVSTTIAEKIDVPLSTMEYNLTVKMANQTEIISDKMNETKDVIEQAAANMTQQVNDTLANFTQQTYLAVEQLQTSANQTLNASVIATTAALDLRNASRKYSWSAQVSPDPALSGEIVTLSCQGDPEGIPVLNIYSWDNVGLETNIYMTQITAGLYQYDFEVDSRFTPGKAYTYVIGDVVTGGLVTGSGMVESMSITTIAGLAAAAPEAERAAKKSLDAIKALESVLLSGDNINIALTLKNLKESVEALPEALGREMPTTKTTEALNELADRLKALGVEEGYDFEELLEKALGESPTIKEVRGKTDAIKIVVDLLLQIFEAKFGGTDAPIVSTSLVPGSVKFRVVAINPSKTKQQMVQVKSYLPQEVTPKDVVELGGLELEYDSEKSIYYVYRQQVELAPSEIRVFEVEVNDIWIIPENTLDDLRKRVDSILSRLENTPYYARGKEIADTIYPRLEEIATTQADETISRSQHVGVYRQNLITLAQVKEDIAKLEKILATAGGPLAPEMLTKTKIKSESPTKAITWLVIFTIITFIGLLGGVLFFTWHRQSRITREELLAAKKTAFPSQPEEKEPDKESQ